MFLVVVVFILVLVLLFALCSLLFALWFLVLGSWFLVLGSWFLVRGLGLGFYLCPWSSSMPSSLSCPEQSAESLSPAAMADSAEPRWTVNQP